MAVTVSLYNHTARRFADGSNAASDAYKVLLLNANGGGFDPSHTTLAAVGGTEVVNDGYASGGATLSNITITTSGNDATWDADDVVWTATNSVLEAMAAVIYNDSDSNAPPLAYIDFGGTQSAQDGAVFRIVWNSSGIFSFTVA